MWCCLFNTIVVLAGKPHNGKKLLTKATRKVLVEESKSGAAIITLFHHAYTQFSGQQGTVLSIYVCKVVSTIIGHNEIQAAAPTSILGWFPWSSLPLHQQYLFSPIQSPSSGAVAAASAVLWSQGDCTGFPPLRIQPLGPCTEEWAKEGRTAAFSQLSLAWLHFSQFIFALWLRGAVTHLARQGVSGL